YKGHVRTCLDIAVRAFQCVLYAVDRDRVSAGDDLEVAVQTGIGRSLDLLDHFVGRDDRLAGEVAALLGEVLVLKLDAGRTGPFIGAHGAVGVDRIAEAGIAVNEQGDVYSIGDDSDVLRHLGHGDQANIRYAEVHIGHAG